MGEDGIQKMSKILVIDAEEGIRYTFGYFLTEKCYEVHTAQNYEEALSLIKYFDYDLIFLDIICGMRECIEIMRTIRNTSDCQIIVTTGVPDSREAEEVLASGAFDYLPKPLRQEKLLQIVSMVFRHKELHNRFVPDMAYKCTDFIAV